MGRIPGPSSLLRIWWQQSSCQVTTLLPNEEESRQSASRSQPKRCSLCARRGHGSSYGRHSPGDLDDSWIWRLAPRAASEPMAGGGPVFEVDLTEAQPAEQA